MKIRVRKPWADAARYWESGREYEVGEDFGTEMVAKGFAVPARTAAQRAASLLKAEGFVGVVAGPDASKEAMAQIEAEGLTATRRKKPAKAKK